MSSSPVARWTRARLVPAALIGTTAALVTASGAFAYAEHAVVKVYVAPKLVHGGDVALNTIPLSASVTESQVVVASTVAIPATGASGQVTFWCSPMTSCPNGYTVAAGTLVESSGGAEYRTLSAVSFPSCAPSIPVSIYALSPGAAGNAGAGAVIYARVPAFIHVTNPRPVGGGADARTLPVVEQSDVDAAIRTLAGKVSSELPAELKARAGALSYVTTGSPSLTTGGNYRIGDHTPTFTVGVTGTQAALGFSAGDARDLLRQALMRQVPAGYQLAPDPISPTYSLRSTTVRGSATGLMIPIVDARALATGLRGQSIAAAGQLLRQSPIDRAAEIQVTPVGTPWLPMMADHISVLVVVDPAPFKL